jgi:hypothetical protein
MVDWVAISSVTTATATLVLAGATFSAVRSSNRSARIAEAALLAGQRPLLMPSRLDDPPVKFGWVDGHDIKLRGGEAHATVDAGIVYLALSVRNSGRGVAVIQGWYPHTDDYGTNPPFPPVEAFRRQSRDLYIGAGDIGFWQAALRDADDVQAAMGEVVDSHARFAVDLLYSDLEGGQRTMTRFGFMPGEQVAWLGSVTRHTNVDRDDPR